MALLIDGYNLLHATGIFGHRGPGRPGPGSLERSRTALLNFLAASIQIDELEQTTIVFDASEAPPGLPRTVVHQGMTVRYASDYEDADTLIERLIEKHSAPRRLVVVSSDHRIHRAARRRKARCIDSDVWYTELVRERRERGQPSPPTASKPQVPLSEAEVEYWLEQFGGDEPTSSVDSSDDREDSSPESPFPPGYGEDLLEDEP